MSIFTTILQKIGIGKPAVDPKVAAAESSQFAQAQASVAAAMAKAKAEAQAKAAASAAAVPAPSAAPVAPAAPAAPVQSAAVPMVDVVAKLEGLAKSHPGLDWKVSIVDLLKLLDIDSSLESRKALANELGCPVDQMNDSARMNIWLHKTVLQKIAENGGNIPPSLLD